MAERPDAPDRESAAEPTDEPVGTEGIPTDADADTNAQLRTIAFRLREIQRLFGVRVAQENRRLEAEGLEPVTEHDAFRSDGGDDDR